MDIRAIIVPYDSGFYHARMGLGPERLFESGLSPLLQRLGHKLTREEVIVPGIHTAEISTTFELCSSVSNRVRQCLQAGIFPIILSGNCNIAVGAIAGCGSETTGVAWFDAHGESTTPETTESGFLDGMGIGILIGACWRNLARRIPNFSPVSAEHVLLVGSRDVEPAEIELLDRMGVVRVTGLVELRTKIKAISSKIEGAYVHVDLDVLDPKEAVANQWTPAGGLTVEILQEAVKEIRKHTQVKGLGIASYDPELDHNQNALKAACAAAESILGGAQ
jgi:arginase